MPNDAGMLDGIVPLNCLLSLPLSPCLLILHCRECTFVMGNTHSFLSFLNFSCVSVLAFSLHSCVCVSAAEEGWQGNTMPPLVALGL